MRKQYIISIASCLITMIACNTKQETCTHEFQDRVWLHRANEIAKARYFQCKYEGLEIDVHFEDSLKTFIVKHDFGENIKDDRNPGYTIEEWCDSLSQISKISLWFDFKNLCPNNKESALCCLQGLREKYNMKGKIYVESNSYECLSIFRDAGFLVSYYIPYYELPIDSTTEMQVMSEIQNAIEQGELTTISGYDYQYAFMKKYFPTIHKLLWVTSEDSNMQKNGLDILESDSLVDVLLLANNFYK